MADAKLNFPITAVDQTAKGVASAGKRFSNLAKEASGVGKDTSGLRRFSQGVAAMEKATSRSFGGRSLAAAAGERFSAVTHVAQTFSEAREGGGGLGGVLGLATSGMGLFAGGVIAAAAAAFSFVDGWSKDAAALGRLSAATGIAAKDLDALAAAGERVGVTREQSNASVSALGKLLNDAQYGRSNDTLALENQLGVGVKRDANGTPDTTAFLAALADKIAAQKNPFTQQEITDRFNVSAMLPLLRRGRAGFLADFNDAKATAQSRDNTQTDLAQDNFSKKARVAQGVARVTSEAGYQGAKVENAGLDATLSGERGLAGMAGRAPQAIAGVVHALEGGAPRIGHALEEGAHVVERGFGRVSQSIQQVVRTIADVARQTGTDMRQMLTTARIESHFDANAHAKGSSAAGVYQFLDRSGAELGVAGDARYDPREAALGYVREMRRDQPRLERRLGRQASPWELYLLHQQGLGGAMKALGSDQSRRAVDVLGRKQVINNGGSSTMTLADFHGLWERRYEDAYRANERQGVFRIAEGGAPATPAVRPNAPAPRTRDQRAVAPIIVPTATRLPKLPASSPDERRSRRAHRSWSGSPCRPRPRRTRMRMLLAPPGPPGAPAEPAATARAEVLIKLAGAPTGTVTRVSARPGVEVKVERAELGS